MASWKMNTVLMFGAALLLTACSSGGDSGTTPPAALTVTLASGLNAGTGTVSSNPAGLACTSNLNTTNCASSFPLGQVVTSPTGTRVTIGTVSDPTNLLQSPPYVQELDSVALLGFSRFLANPNTTQPFFVDATFTSLTKIITPGLPAEWEEVGGN
ncbi:MAG: hypothetical protein Q8N00_17175 [Nitrospirota bacterium]|nr:hypothetical protein [Nitrospirota bacterium]MDP3596361.1 hypothetical protein [Nitrospirota bacterium]